MTLRENSEYEELKNEVVKHVAMNDQYIKLLNSLKELYRDVINSPRRYETITKIGQLLRILEIRDVLSENTVAPLKQIAQRLPNSQDLLQRINKYESNTSPAHLVNYYESEKTVSTQAHETIENTMTNKPNTNISSLKKQSITETIVEDIGYNWRDFARGLDIKERIIDELNVKYNTFNEKAKCVMELYNNKPYDNETTWFFDLCDALETCQRRELVRKIKKIMVMNK